MNCFIGNNNLLGEPSVKQGGGGKLGAESGGLGAIHILNQPEGIFEKKKTFFIYSQHLVQP